MSADAPTASIRALDPPLASSDDAMLAEQFRAVAAGRLDLLADMLLACLVFGLLGRFYPPWAAASWLGLMSLVNGARFGLRLLYRRRVDGTPDFRNWGMAFTAASAAGGFLWGVTATVIWVSPDPIAHLFVLFTLGGLMVGGTTVKTAYLPAWFAFLISTVALPVILLLTRPTPMAKEMGLMLGGFAVVLGLSGRSISRSLIEYLTARLSQVGLSSRLAANEAAMAEAQAIAKMGSWRYDSKSHEVLWSKQMWEIVGLDPHKTTLSPQSAVSVCHPEDLPALTRTYQGWDAGEGERQTDHRIVMPDGRLKWVRERVRIHQGETADGSLHLVGTVQDITERRTAQEKLDLGVRVLKALTEASEAGVLVVDTAGLIISYNARLTYMIGVPASELEGGRDEVVIARAADQVVQPPDLVDRLRAILARPEDSWRVELETVEADLIDLRTEPLRSAAGETLGRIWFLLDVTARRRAEALALRQARFDTLTGLANRGVFVEAVGQAIAAAKRAGPAFAVLYLDLDRFKDVNDTLGHPIGDELLKAVAARLLAVTRVSDTLARFGGDEFALIALGAGEPSEAARLAEKLILAVAEPFDIQANAIHIGVSVGLELYGPKANETEILLAHADQALYRAKAEGRGQYRFFTSAMDSDVRARVAMGGELQRAIRAGALTLLYRPQVDAQTGRINGLEATPRWRHPSQGILRPHVFLPVAEQMGLAAELGHWALLTACAAAAAWRAEGLEPVRMCVNLYAQQFKAPFDLEADVLAILARTGLPPENLELALTETVLMAVALRGDEVLPRLRAAGVSIAIDKFGAGYSSLEYLSRFAADRIKIARAFVRGLDTTPGDASVVKMIIGLARDLGITVVAEGVERAAQLELLKAWGCREVTGPYFAHALDASDTGKLLRRGTALPAA